MLDNQILSENKPREGSIKTEISKIKFQDDKLPLVDESYRIRSEKS